MKPGATQRARDLEAARRSAEANAKAAARDVARPEVQLAEARRQLDLVRAEVDKLPEYPRSPMFREGELGAQLERIEFAGQEVHVLRDDRWRLRRLLAQCAVALEKFGDARAVSGLRAAIAEEMAAPAFSPQLEGGS